MTRRLRFGLCTDQNLSWEATLERWRLFERLGFDSAWDCDHFLQPSRPHGQYLEAWTLLAALAARTERIRVGVLVSSNTFRHPALLAKEAVTVDHVSGGRLELGLGAGWYEPEHAMYGIELPPPRELVDRFEEAVEVVDGLLRGRLTSYEGRHYRLRDPHFQPPPAQRPRPPLTLGAHGPRMLRIAARYADAWSSFGTAEQIRSRNGILDEACGAIGRDPGQVLRSLYYWVPRAGTDPWSSTDAFLDVVGRYREAGIEEFIIDHPRDDQLDMLERVAADVLPRLRAEAETAGGFRT
ncbi:MAG TPA: LLM class flavin-dependent oxidoreductase [Candidatus Eisenbacteria bacterium]|nr:LLM class flavin-dependent oxidoreductase [Candidatus Eisenbacteria bacterium]